MGSGEMEFEMATAPIISDAGEIGMGGEMQQSSVAPLVARLNELMGRDPEQAAVVFRRWLHSDAGQ
jgi:flagellar biosynthesis/type III secretory pathway M-ring protein FliF/YscJ